MILLDFKDIIEYKVIDQLNYILKYKYGKFKNLNKKGINS